ncbi:MAG TPA: hypothetical protein VGD00_10155 [Solirubrobacteraceae bacterium]|jgi:hypothetical protein
MSDASEPIEFHLILDAVEVVAAAQAVRLYISDAAHQPEIRTIAREVLASLSSDGEPDAALTVPLTAPQMKITYSAVRLLLDDLQREQAQERETLHAILDKLPDEHVMNAIRL